MNHHLFIGIGGQGGKSLAALRRVIAQRETDAAEMKQLGVNWDFLGIDSSTDVQNSKKLWEYFGRDVSLHPQSDWVQLSGVSSSEVDGLAIRADIQPWIGNRQQIKSFLERGNIEGANQRRRFGRLLYAKHAQRILNAVAQKVSGFTATREQQCAFHIFCSLGGGTGSGGIIDLITSIRTKYPETRIDQYPIFLHVFVTSSRDDLQSASKGYFSENQFAALRDLNALMCLKARPTIAAQMLGDGKPRGAFFNGSDPIQQLIVSSNLNQRNQGVPIDLQIQVVAEACFERIYAWGQGQMDANTQQSMTGQDLLGSWPGEPLETPERSYRFASVGMRRWEVPHAKVSDLLAHHLMESSLRQMLYGNWEHNFGYAANAAVLLPETAKAHTGTLADHVNGFFLTTRELPELTQELRREVTAFGQSTRKRKDGGIADLSTVRERAEDFYRKSFRQVGAAALLNQKSVAHQSDIDSSERELDRALTRMWVDPAEPVALKHLTDLLDALDASLQKQLGDEIDLTNANERLESVCAQRHAEWEKIAMLSALFGKRESLLAAHAQDAAALCVNDLQTRGEKLDRELLNGITSRLTKIKNAYDGAFDLLKKWLDETGTQIREITRELAGLLDGNANKYEFNTENLKGFISDMLKHPQHTRETSLVLRQTVLEKLRGGSLSQLSKLEPTSDGSSTGDSRLALLEEMRRVARLRGKQIYATMQANDEAKAILEDSVLKVLARRLGGQPIALRDEVTAFINQAASSLHLRDEPQPSTLLGPSVDAQMPKRILLMGLPRDNPGFSQQLVAEFKKAQVAGVSIHCDIYHHQDPTQLRLLFIDYWLALRFSTVASDLHDKFKIDPTKDPTFIRYFCNLDPDGEEGKRPSLFLPSAQDMRARYEAELWLARQSEIGVVQASSNGVYLIKLTDSGVEHTELLGATEAEAKESAHDQNMHALHGALTARITALPDGPKVVARLLEAESTRIKGEKNDVTTPEFQHWSRNVRPQLERFAI